MIPVSAAFKAALENNAVVHKLAAVTLLDGTTLSLGDNEFTISNSELVDSAGSGSFPIGQAICRTIQFEIINDQDQYEDVSFLGAVILLSAAVDTGSGMESVTLGTFTVTTPETYGTTVILQAQDAMYKADKPFSSALAYPTTAGALWAEICSSCGISNGMTTIPEASAPISAAPENTTFRAVLGNIAMLSGGNARVTRLGELVIVNYDFATLATQRQAETAEGIHDLTAWKQLRTAMDDVVITGLKTTAVDGTDVSVGTDDYALQVGNPLFNGREQAALQTLGDYLIGARFRPFSGDYIATPLIEFGDGCRLTDRRGRLSYSVITDMQCTFTGFTALANSAEDPVRSSSTYTGPEAKAIQAAGQLIAVERSAREAAVAALANQLAGIDGMYFTTQSAAGGGTIYLIHNAPAVADSEVVLKLTGSALGISTDGGQTYPTGWNFADGTTITNILNTIGISADWINTGALTIRDANNNVIFQADKDTRIVQIGGLTAAYDRTFNTLYTLDGSCALICRGEAYEDGFDYEDDSYTETEFISDGMAMYRGDENGGGRVLVASLSSFDRQDLTRKQLLVETPQGLSLIFRRVQNPARYLSVEYGTSYPLSVRYPLEELDTVLSGLSALQTRFPTSYAGSLNSVPYGNICLLETDGSTLNTPYAAGLSSWTMGAVISYCTSASYGTQVYFSRAAREVFIRRLYEGAWSAWVKIPTENDLAPSSVTVTDVNVYGRNLQVNRIGRLVTVSGWVRPKAQAYAAVSTALVKLGTAPAERTFFVGSGNGTTYGMELTAAGNIVFNSSSPTFSGNPYIYMNFTYITAT